MSIEALVTILENLNEAHLTLLDIARQKGPILVKNQVEELNQLVNKENKIMRQVVQMDEQRIEAINKYLFSRGYHPNPKITISDLAKVMFKHEEKRMLLDAQERLVQTITELKKEHALNMKLIEQSLAFINYSLDVVLGPEESPIYEHPAHQTYGNKRNGMFDTRA